MLRSAGHENFNAHKYKISRNSAQLFQAKISLECYFSSSFIITRRKNNVFSCSAELTMSCFITSGPDLRHFACVIVLFVVFLSLLFILKLGAN